MKDDKNLTKPDSNDEKELGFYGELFDWLSSIFSAILCFIIIFTIAARLITVDGDSMKPTLENTERLVVSDMFYQPAYGDIVIIYADKLVDITNGKMGKPIVKRVIGLPGDVIRIDFERGIVYRNGTELKEDYIKAPTMLAQDFPNNTDVVIEEGKVFVMGDNRNESKDSRSNDVGQVDIRYIMGKAYFRVWPFSRFGSIY
ncbi:MAG: signal peptidase I [Eubacterium sp.]|nr:signal peptidase I [Eubacterium sp.]